jgi:hypothetical protein
MILNIYYLLLNNIRKILENTGIGRNSGKINAVGGRAVL